MERVTVTGRQAYFNQGARFFGDVNLHVIENREDAPYRRQLFIDDYGKIYADYGALFVWDSDVVVGIVSTIDFGYNLSVSPRISGIVTVTSYSTLWDDKSYVGLVTTIDFGHNLILTPESSGVSTVTSYVTVLDSNRYIGLVTSINFGDYLIVSGIESGIVRVDVGIETGEGGGGGGGPIFGGGGGGESYWVKNVTGIHTFSNVGIGTSTLSSAFQVVGNSTFNGNVGIGTSTLSSAFQVVGNSTFNGNVGIGSSLSVVGFVTAPKFFGSGIYVPTMYVGETPPTTAFPGNLWYDSNVGRTFLYYEDSDSTQWIDLSPPDPVLTVTISDTPPTSPLVGNLWFNSTDGRAYIYYADVDSTQWVDFSPDGTNYSSLLVENYWSKNNTGIHTSLHVGLGTNDAIFPLTLNGVMGFVDGNITIGDFDTGANRTSAGGNNIFLGSGAGYCHFNNNNTIAIGKDAGYWNRADGNIYIGECSGSGRNSFRNSGECNTGVDNIFIGKQTGASNLTGENNVFLGKLSGYYNSTGSSNVFIGRFTGYYNSTGSFNTYIGESAGLCAGCDGSYNNFFGYRAGAYNYCGSHNNFFGTCAGYENCGNANVFIGEKAGKNNTSGAYNVFFGQCSGFFNRTGCSNVFVGEKAGHSNTFGAENIFIGKKAGYANTTGYRNIFIGECTGYNSLVSYDNNFFGNVAGYNNVEGYKNTFIGQAAGFYNTEGHDNAYFGNYTGTSQLASYKILLGQGTALPTFTPPDFVDWNYFDAYFPNKDKQLAIGLNTTGQSEYWLVGDENLNIGIGTAIPNAKLDVVGSARFTGIVTADKFSGDGSLLTNIPNIIASRWSPSAQGQSVGIWTSGSVGIGTIDVSRAKLTVVGNVIVSGTGIVTATQFDGNIVNANTIKSPAFIGTFIGDGSGITNLSKAGQWDYNSSGIYTGLNIGIGTTTASNRLTVSGRQEFVGFNVKIGMSSETTPLYTLTPEEKFNTFIGYRPGYNNTTGCGNNYIGYYAGTSSANAYGSWNNFMGAFAGQCNFSGSSNNFFGYEAGRANTSGGYNNFFGECAGKRNTTGSYNIFFGRFTGSYNTTGSWNIFLGCSTGRCNITGRENVFIGRDTGLYSTGNYNSFFGAFAGCDLRSGSYNVAIGYSAQLLDDYGSHQLAIGAGNSSWIIGNNDFFVGIGSTAPIAKFTVYGDSHFQGIATFAKIYGDGSGLYNITATVSPGINIRNNGNFVGVAATLNFDGFFDASPVSAGIVTVSINDSIRQLFIWESTYAGINTISRVGLGSTAPRQALDVRGNAIVSGVVTATTFNATSLIVSPSATIDNLTNIVGNVFNIVGNNIQYVGYGTITNLQGINLNYGVGVVTNLTSTNITASNITANTSLVSAGLVSFRNGPVLIGGGTSTGTSNQKLQIAGNSYFNGTIGVGTTNPRVTVDIIGNEVVSGFVSAAQFIGDGSGLTGVIAANADSLWIVTSAGIHTLAKVGIGTTNPTSQLTISGILEFVDDNVKIGSKETGALLIKNIGILNSFVGVGAAASITSGAYNSFFGSFTGKFTTTGCYNSFFGSNAGQCNTTGDSNSFFGFLAGRCNTTGFRNSFFGRSSGVCNTTGRTNSFFGFYSGVNNATGCNNTFFGSFVGCSQNSSYKIVIGSGQGASYFDFPVVERGKTLAIGINSLGFNEYWLVGNERLNIGIGTTNPNSRLSVGGDVDVAGVVTSRRLSTGSIIGTSITGTALSVTSISGTDIFVSGNGVVSGIFTAGVVTATSFFGDGSKLTGIIAEGSGVLVRDDDILLGTASVLNFGENISLTSIVSGITTVNVVNYWSSGGTGIITTGSIGIGTTSASSTLTVYGDALITGVVTASAFFGDVGYARTSGISTYARTAGVATYASIAGVSTNVNGGTANVIGLNVTGITTLGNANISNINSVGVITAGVVTATTFFGDGSKLTGISVGISSVAEYAKVAGISTIAGIATNVSGGTANVTSLNVSGITTLGPTNISNIINVGIITAGIVTATTFFGDGSKLTGISAGISSVAEYAKVAGIATIAGVATSVIGGVASVTQLNVTGISTLGVVTATTYYGDGSFLTGITASQWVTTSSGIHTLSNVGIGTTNPTSRLTVSGDGLFTGVVTATSFYGDGSQLTGIVAQGSGVSVRDSGSLIGIAATLDFGDNLTVTFNSGYATIDSVTGISTQWITTPVGIHTFTNLGVGTATPTSRLHVIGDAIITGVVTAGIVSATTFFGDGSKLTGISAGISSVAEYARVAGIATYAQTAGIATYATRSGVSTYASVAGLATYSSSAGVATYASSSGISTSVSGGFASVTNLNVTGISTLGVVTVTQLYSAGIVTALRFIGDGSQLSGVAAETSKQWITTSVGIHTLVNVGVGTTNPTSKLTVAGNLYVTGIITSTDYDSLSDRKLKTNIEPIQNPIETVKQIRGVTFDWKNTNRSSAGVVAQEIEKVLPQLVNGDETKSVNYNGLIGLLIECVKEQQKEIDELKKRLL